MKKNLKDLFLTDLGNKIEKITKSFLVITIVVCFLYVCVSTYTKFPQILMKTEGSNLGLLLKSLQENWFLSFLLSFLVTYLIFIFWMLFILILNFNHTIKILKISLLCSLGVFLITFIFVFILASTNPSNNTIVFSALSAIGASISFCYTVFNNNKG
jgi:hypothetical protein